MEILGQPERRLSCRQPPLPTIYPLRYKMAFGIAPVCPAVRVVFLGYNTGCYKPDYAVSSNHHALHTFCANTTRPHQKLQSRKPQAKMTFLGGLASIITTLGAGVISAAWASPRISGKQAIAFLSLYIEPLNSFGPILQRHPI